MKIGSIIDPHRYRVSGMSLVFFDSPSELIREQGFEVPNLDSNVGFELGTEVPTFSIDLLSGESTNWAPETSTHKHCHLLRDVEC